MASPENNFYLFINVKHLTLPFSQVKIKHADIKPSIKKKAFMCDIGLICHCSTGSTFLFAQKFLYMNLTFFN